MILDYLPRERWMSVHDLTSRALQCRKGTDPEGYRWRGFEVCPRSRGDQRSPGKEMWSDLTSVDGTKKFFLRGLV